MKKRIKRYHTGALFVLGAFFVAICGFYIIKLVNMQITGVDKYISGSTKTYVRYETVQAVRGEIYDRNGKALVKNEYTNTIQLSYNSLKNFTPLGKNGVIAEISRVLEDYGEDFTTRFPIKGTYPHVSYDEEKLENKTSSARFYSFLEKNGIDKNISCVDLFEWFIEYYEIKNARGNYVYEGRTQYDVIAVRYELDTMNFAPDTPFIIKEEAKMELVTAVLERASTGIYVSKEWKRTYEYPMHASHILGRVGKIPADEIEKYLADGYNYDAVVGLDGAEKAFEELLKGSDGVVKITEDEYGGIISTETETEVVPGRNVYLTIDIDMQIDAEKKLLENINEIVEDAESDEDGRLADSGAVSVIDPNNGQVLALASYPSYDLSMFTEKYADLLADEKQPLFNRALMGNYAPGSTFKVATSAAALTNGIVTPSSSVDCEGEYKYYSDYQPDCWNTHGHGPIDLVGALGVSCNCYFYDVGRRLGIEALNDYCTTLGLGQYTGIELLESKGVIAGPVYYSEQNLGLWNPGDTLQAAIGQSKNAVTPLQLSMYISTVINSGIRYKATVLYKSETYSGQDTVYNEPVILGEAELSDEHCEYIRRGMKEAKENTSTTKRYKFDIGVKTGTAQITKSNNNAVLTAFAPYDDPEIVVSCVIENGATGRKAATAVLGIISTHFGLDKNGSPIEEEETENTEALPEEETRPTQTHTSENVPEEDRETEENTQENEQTHSESG